MAGKLSDKVAVITGGASGIGRAACLRLAGEGCHVAVIDIDENGAEKVAAESAKSGVETQALKADVSDEIDIETAVAKVLTRFKRLDYVVSNAGIEGAMKDFGDTSAEEWDRVMAVNVRGAFLTVRACLPTLSAQKSGAIVLTASNYGFVAT